MKHLFWKGPVENNCILLMFLYWIHADLQYIPNQTKGGQSLSERIQVDLAPCIGNFCFFISIQMTAVYSGWRKSEGSHRNLKIVWYTHFCSWYHISKSLHLNAAVLSYNWGALCNLCWIVYGHSWHAFAALHSISCGITEPLMKQNGCW